MVLSVPQTNNSKCVFMPLMFLCSLTSNKNWENQLKQPEIWQQHCFISIFQFIVIMFMTIISCIYNTIMFNENRFQKSASLRYRELIHTDVLKTNNSTLIIVLLKGFNLIYLSEMFIHFLNVPMYLSQPFIFIYKYLERY